MDRYRKLYDFMVENGELKKMFPKMTGQWELDGERFIKEQKKQEEILGFDVTE